MSRRSLELSRDARAQGWTSSTHRHTHTQTHTHTHGHGGIAKEHRSQLKEFPEAKVRTV